MDRIAVPKFRSRIAPVLDTCTRLLIVDLEQNREAGEGELYVNGFSLSERVDMLKRSKVTRVICACASELFFNLLTKEGIGVTSGIIGEVDQVVEALVRGQLEDPRFRMPGRVQNNKG